MERNLRLYPAFKVWVNLHFWMPVFFLYFSSILPLARVLQLEAVYYIAVVSLEIPSGWFSDSVGRRATLLVSAGGMSAGFALFAVTSSFGAFALAQVLFAVSMAFLSGTDTSLLYESLAALGREEEFGAREAAAQRLSYIATGGAALLGGAAAGFDLRWPYILTASAGLFAVLSALGLAEPPKIKASAESAFLPQLKAAWSQLGDSVLLWIFVCTVAMTVFKHVPYEFLQPYLEMVLGGDASVGYSRTPLASGMVTALMLAVAAWASGRSMQVKELLGVPGALLISLGVEIALISAMGLVLSPVVLPLFLLRSFWTGVYKPITASAVHPRLNSGIRATYLSMESFAGRILFSASLLGISRLAGTGGITPDYLSQALLIYAVAAVHVLLLLGGKARAVDFNRPRTLSNRIP